MLEQTFKKMAAPKALNACLSPSLPLSFSLLLSSSPSLPPVPTLFYGNG